MRQQLIIFYLLFAKSVGYVTALRHVDRLNCNERVHPYPLNDRAAAYKRERECVRGVVGWLRM